MRVKPEEFRRIPLFVHAFLADVPLHDVWAIPLEGGGDGRTLHDLQTLLNVERAQRVNPVVSSLFRLRWALGRLFGWDKEQHRSSPISYTQRLSPADRARSLEEPGSERGPFQVVYTFENEALSEIINGTVHAFSLMALTLAGGGYLLYWAIYVKRINRLTPFYMALIDPFRRFIVYPSIIKNIQQAWTGSLSPVRANSH